MSAAHTLWHPSCTQVTISTNPVCCQPTDEYTEEEFDFLMDTNFKSCFHR